MFVIDHKRDLAAYIADNYGMCTAPGCRCLLMGWIGTACPYWVPVKATNWKELRDEISGIQRTQDGGARPVGTIPLAAPAGEPDDQQEGREAAPAGENEDERGEAQEDKGAAGDGQPA